MSTAPHRAAPHRTAPYARPPPRRRAATPPPRRSPHGCPLLTTLRALATAHKELLPLTGKGQTYTMSGYCYSGGGRKVIRVEVSLDGGKTWALTTLRHPETPTEYGKYWCWCFWSHEIDVASLWLMEGAELLCRGWDESMNRQPEQITWNVMGMMNNSYFRTKVHQVQHPETGMPALQFQHPTQAGPGNFGGWFEEKSMGSADAPKADAPKAEAKAPPKAGGKVLTMEEVEKHNTDDDCWIVIKDRVYDATKYLDSHPGGRSSITIASGSDTTDDFEALHSSKAWKLIEEYYIGTIGEAQAGGAAEPAAVPTGAAPPAAAAAAAAEEAPVEAAKALDPKKWVTFPLIEREDINHNTRRYRFGLPTAMHDLGLPVGQHIFIKGTVDGKPVMRAYTPLGHGPGYVDFVIKAYFPLEPRFPNGGLLTMHMETLAVGDTMQFKGPLGEYVFNTGVLHPRTGVPVAQVEGALSTFSKNGQKTPYKVLGLIAGGSGITPCLQVATALLEANADVRIKLLYANQSPDDILCQQELDRIAADDRVDVWYTVDRVAEGTTWPYSQGFISEDMLREHMPVADEHTCIFMCGPPPMLDRACKPNLAKLGHPESRMHCF